MTARIHPGVKKIDLNATISLDIALTTVPSLHRIAKQIKSAGWEIYAVDQSCGRCYYGKKVITIPTWAMKSKQPNYWVWYVAHEFSHYLAGHKAEHGPEFMKRLIEICPEDCLHYELGYKPRNASAAGINYSKANTRSVEYKIDPEFDPFMAL